MYKNIDIGSENYIVIVGNTTDTCIKYRIIIASCIMIHILMFHVKIYTRYHILLKGTRYFYGKNQGWAS